MPPRTRSNHAEKLAKERLLASGVALNTHGFPNLPDELYLEILSYMPSLKLPQDSWFIDAKPDPYRQLSLFSLSQTCQSLRRFFLKYAWEQIEVFEGMWTPEGRLLTKAEKKRGADLQNGDKKLVQEILRQLETVTIRNPELACHVNAVNLKILHYNHSTVIKEIAERMTHLPNLHTLQLIFFWTVTTYPSSYSYPQIHTLSLNNSSPHKAILAACPNVRRFANYKGAGSVLALESILHADCAAHLEVLGVQTFFQPEFVKFLPRLRDLALNSSDLRISGEALMGLSSLPLHTLRLILVNRGLVNIRRPPTPAERQSWISLAKRILEKCPQQKEQKKVVVVNYDKTVEIHLI